MRRYLGLCFLLTLALAPGIGDAQSKHKKKSVTQLRSHLRNIKSQKSALKKKLRETTRAVNVVRGDIHEVDARLTHVENQLEETTDRLDKGRKEQKTVAAQLIDVTKRFELTKEQVRQRLRWMYIHGDTSGLTILTGASSTGDLATRAYVMERIAKKDRDLFSNYRSQREEITAKKRRKDQLVVEIRGLVDTQKHQHASLESVKDEKSHVLKGLQAKQGELKELLAQFEADERQIQGQIEAFMRSQASHGQVQGPAPKGRFGRPSNGRMTSSFGMRYHPILHINRMHTGVDFGSPYGSPIFAANDGVVIAAQKMRGYGNVVIVDHGGGISTVYGHCSRILVGTGQRVKRGQRIANVGSTGLSTGPHLHFEVRVKGRPVNPMRYL